MTSKVVFSGITLFTPDMAKLADFYNMLGLNLKPDAGWGGINGYLDILEADGQQVFFQIRRSNEGDKVNYINLQFRVENITELFVKCLELGVEIIRPGNKHIWPAIKKEPSGLTLMVVRDPDGRSVQLNQLKK